VEIGEEHKELVELHPSFHLLAVYVYAYSFGELLNPLALPDVSSRKAHRLLNATSNF